MGNPNLTDKTGKFIEGICLDICSWVCIKEIKKKILERKGKRDSQGGSRFSQLTYFLAYGNRFPVENKK